MTIRDCIKHPRTAALKYLKESGGWIPDKIYLRLLFLLEMDKWPNFRNPKTFSEKLQWLKLYYRKPEQTVMVDKYAVKDYVAGIIGNEYIIPTLGVWDRPEDIEWDKLPNQFVLKCTHDSGGLVICRDKYNIDKGKAIKKLSNSLQKDYYLIGREWPYRDVPRRIIAEKYIEPSPGTNDLPDYKFFCFNGRVRAMFIGTDRNVPGKEVKFDFYDENFNWLPFRQGHDHATTRPSKPHNFEKMKQLASLLSEGMPHVRVDFYDLGDRVLFGEMTLYHFSGLMPFEPSEWDYKFGDMIALPTKWVRS